MSLPQPAVAIIGISAELPSGNITESNLDHESFFQFLLEKGEAYEEVPANRFNIDAWQGSNLGQVPPRKACFLKNISQFDHAEFGIAAKDAHTMALSTRKLLEHSFLALLDSGIDWRGQNIGVYTAGTAFDAFSMGEHDIFEARGLLSGIPSMIANKISYHLDSTGPSVPVDTACSSSLTALHLATQALRAGECKAALVRGCQLNHRFIDFVHYSQSSVLAPDGKCKPFDAAADGFGRGEGIVVMVVKLLDEAIHDGLIPPNVNIVTPNPAIHWKEYNIQVPTQITKLGRRSDTSLISMTNSGIGGSTGHVIVAAPPSAEYAPGTPLVKPVLLLAGGLSPQSASEVAATLAAANLFDDASTLSTIYGRRSRQLTWCTFATWTPGQKTVVFPPPILSPKFKAPIVFVFSGQGPQHFNMGRQLFRDFETFRANIGRMDAVYQRCTGHSLLNEGLFGPGSTASTFPDVWPIAITQPALIILEIALYDLFVAHGVTPDIVVAHSAGETAMLYAAGAISQEMAVEIATARGLAMRSVEAFGGAMAAVGCNGDQAIRIIEHVMAHLDGGVLEVGCYNGPDAVALSGSDATIDLAVAFAQSQGFFARKIKTRVAGHSSLMERCREDYQARMQDIYSRYPGARIPSRTTYSTQTGARWVAPFSPEYMWTNARCPVHFAKAIAAIYHDHPDAVFVEISPHPVLTSYIATGDVKPDFVIAPMRRSKNLAPFAETTDYLDALGKLVCFGSNRVDFQALNGHAALKRLALPAYPFKKRTIPYRTAAIQAAVTEGRVGPLNYKDMALNVLTHPDFYPTGYCAFELGASHLWNVEFSSMLPLLKEKVLRVEITTDQHRWEVNSWAPDQLHAPRRLHASGYLTREGPVCKSTVVNVQEIRARCAPLPVKGFYDSISYFAQYGPAFRQIRQIWAGDNEAISHRSHNIRNDTKYIINPAILDSCLHVLIHLAFTGDANQSTYYLPSRIQEVLLHTKGRIPSTLYSYSVFRKWNPDHLVFDIFIVDAGGSGICSMLGAQITKHGVSPDRERLTHYETEYQPMSSSALASPVVRSHCTDYGFLDTLVEHPGSTSEQSAHGRILDSVKTLKAIPVQILSEFSYPAEAAITQVRDVLDHFITQGKTVVSLSEIGNVSGSLSGHIRALSEEYPNISFSCVSSGFVTHPSDISSGLPSFSFDPNQDLTNQGLSLGYLHDLIVPGGFLILSEVGGGPVPEATWIDAVFPPHGGWKGLSAGREYHRFDASTWRTALHHNRFTASASDAPSELFLVLRAQRDALNISAFPHSTTDTNQKDLHTVTFPSPHHALDLYDLVSDLERSPTPETLWIEATKDTVAGAAARGFTRSLRQKGLNTDIPSRLVLFDTCWRPDSRTAILRYFAGFSNLEKESPQAGGVLVQILSVSSFGSLRGVVGVVQASRCASWVPGTRVVGVSASELSNVATSVEGEIAELPANADVHTTSTTVVPLLVLALALGSHLVHTERLIGQRVHIAVDDSLSEGIRHVWEILNLDPATLIAVPESLSTSTVVIATAGSDSAALQALTSRLSRNASLFVWDDPVSGVYPRLQRERWLAGDVLQKYLPTVSAPRALARYAVSGKAPKEYLPTTYQISTPKLFDPERVYLLVGGIGSLGIHLSLWLYTRGARRIVLTSRSGAASMNSPIKQMLNRVLGYLKALPDLELRLEAPLAGCILLTALLVDGLFMSFGADSASRSDYAMAIDSKIGAFQVLEKVISIEKLDFFMSTRQTNYSSANTALEWLTGRSHNAFSLVAPGITDSTFGVSQFTISEPHSMVWLKWAMSSQHLSKCVEDGLKRMRAGSFETYVPDFDWDAVNGHLRCIAISSRPSHRELHLDKSELNPAVPLTSYGLDSLSASRLSSALKPLFVITQLQLLADITLQDLEDRLTQSDSGNSANTGDTASPEDLTAEKPFDWKVVNQHDDNIIKLVIGQKGDVPLIIIHGGDGSSALWAIQYTTDTPLSSFDDLTSFYFAQIKQARPEGPYRLGAFSAGCVFALDVDSETGSFGTTRHESAVGQVYALLRSDRHENWTTSDPRNNEAKQMPLMVKKTGSVMIPYLMRLTGRTTSEVERQAALTRLLSTMIDEVKAPITVYLAGRGILGLMRELCPAGEWDDFGVSRCQTHIDTVMLEDKGHFSLFSSKEFSDALEKSWKL
ncbi:beta-ketoacyl synthase [Mycena albidolilacea]|uniref:Beta-ketoacyl synthase n=1 Tax=Mycena albidolilacea TaxID=1033008 RepID=A0AAD6ZZF0_9AGAR|nr:beta-ketoacyl synthase [Mycena albidolilacea]